MIIVLHIRMYTLCFNPCCGGLNCCSPPGRRSLVHLVILDDIAAADLERALVEPGDEHLVHEFVSRRMAHQTWLQRHRSSQRRYAMPIVSNGAKSTTTTASKTFLMLTPDTECWA